MNIRNVAMTGVLAFCAGIASAYEIGAMAAPTEVSFATASAPEFERAVLTAQPLRAPADTFAARQAIADDLATASSRGLGSARLNVDASTSSRSSLMVTAVPEPNAPLLMLAGLAVVGMLLRRRALHGG